MAWNKIVIVSRSPFKIRQDKTLKKVLGSSSFSILPWMKRKKKLHQKSKNFLTNSTGAMVTSLQLQNGLQKPKMHLFCQVRKTIIKSVDHFQSCFFVKKRRRLARRSITSSSKGYTTIFCGRRVSSKGNAVAQKNWNACRMPKIIIVKAQIQKDF